MNLSIRKYFTDETLNHLYSSFKKAGFDEIYLNKLIEWLSQSPKWSTLRVNTNRVDNIDVAVEEIQSFLNNSLELQNQLLSNQNLTLSVPKCKILNNYFEECVTYEPSKFTQTKEIKKYNKFVIIDSKCAQAIYRGADIFVPGIIALTLNAKAMDTISVYCDLNGKCSKGSDAKIYMENKSDSLVFIANGWLMFDRDEIFKYSDAKSGVGVKIMELSDGTYIPSFDNLDVSKYFPQNLPSMICAKVLDPQPGELILDMCAAPGGKTTHIAEIIKNNGKIIAFDKLSSKISKMKELCHKLDANCIECFVQDATKLDLNIYKPESFDRILVDAPCSALGQRPLVISDIDKNHLKSYVNYQRKILENAVKLLKPGGFMVYSTCTITIEENEEQVSWLLNRYKNLKLIDQSPLNLSASCGLACEGLDENQAKLLQRFTPNFRSDTNDLKNVFVDTNGFFISKFFKEL